MPNHVTDVGSLKCIYKWVFKNEPFSRELFTTVIVRQNQITES